jgi:hypothetical protein
LSQERATYFLQVKAQFVWAFFREDRRFLVYKIPCERDFATGVLEPGPREALAVSGLTIYHWSFEGGVYANYMGQPRLVAMEFSRPPNYHGGRSQFAAKESLHLLMCGQVPANIQEKAVQSAAEARGPGWPRPGNQWRRR